MLAAYRARRCNNQENMHGPLRLESLYTSWNDIWRGIKFITGEYIANGYDSALLKSVESIKNVYAKRGFVVKHMLMDGQFECLRERLTGKGVNLIICSEDEHISEIECLNQTISERVRAAYVTIPYKCMPGQMVVELLHFAIFWLNTFPPPPAICAPLSPHDLITGKHVDYNRHVCLEFGNYVHTHENHGNNTQP
eukprot:5706463-Ditylum_brightwellii.AAC.1